MALIGLMGAHRTGKTTLAREYAKRHGVRFVETSVGSVFTELDLSPKDDLSFAMRLTVQEAILTRVSTIYASVMNEDAIVDRTPLDFAGYTMAEASAYAVNDEDQTRFATYIQKCIEATNRYFSTLILVQPGIPLVEAEGKAVSSAAYIEHLNSLMLGLSADERVRAHHFYIPRGMTEMDDRIKAVTYADSQTRKRWRNEFEGQTAH